MTYPPRRLLRAKTEARHLPEVAQTAVTMTHDGRWALKIWLHVGAPRPLPTIGTVWDGFPVVYDYEPATVPVARPAYPRRGE